MRTYSAFSFVESSAVHPQEKEHAKPAPNINCNEQLVLTIITEYDQALRTYFYNRLRSHNDVEDFLQELYCRALNYKKASQIVSVKNFIYTIALNLVRDNARRCSTKIVKDSIPIEEDMFYDESIEPERIIEDRSKLEQINKSIKTLSSNCQKAFWLNRVEGLSYKEVALKMGVTVSMIEKHIMQATKKISATL